MQRLTALRVALVIILVILVGRLYQLQLTESATWGYGSDVEANTTRYVAVEPRRGEILSRDGTTLLAESVPQFHIAVRTGNLPPFGTQQRDFVLGEVALLSGITSTLTLSPALALNRMPTLSRDLRQLVGDDQLLKEEQNRQEESRSSMTFTIEPEHILNAISLSWTYSDTLELENPVETKIIESNTRHYKSVVIKEDISPELALIIQENSQHIPGGIVVKDYQRRYPQSDRIPSLSHMLGYIGRINECELVEVNPSTSWMDSLVESIGYVNTCGVFEQHIVTDYPGLPPYQNDDYIGKDGLEASYEQILRGELGIESVLVDSLERPVSNNRTEKPVQDGNNLVLTIDAAFQQQTEMILRQWLEIADERRKKAEEPYKQEYPPIRSGSVVVLDPRNGAVLAMVSLPAYDNNMWVDPERQSALQNLLNPNDPRLQEELERLSPLTNRAISGQYPPGSTVKQFVASAALQKHIIEPDTELRDPGKLVIEEQSGLIFELPNSDPRDNGYINVSDALMVSSNVFLASIAGGNQQVVNIADDDPHIRGLTIDGLQEGMEWFRFGKPTMIRLPGEAIGRVPSPMWKSRTLREPWTTGDTYNTSIGQGYMEVTPLQLAVAAAAVANGGTIYRPQLVLQVTDTNGNIILQQEPEILDYVPVESDFLSVVREGMRRSVTDGLNVAARDPCSGLQIAGKTGTAEYGPLILKDDDTYARRSHAWFVGFAPYENPEVLVVVLLEGAGDMEDGSSTLAVPAVTQVLQAYFQVQPPAEPPQDCPWMP